MGAETVANPTESEAKAVESLLASLQSILRTRLQAVYRFGSEAARGKAAGHQRLLVLVDVLDRDVLDEVSGPVWTAQKAGVRVRLDTAENLIRGSDAFPAFTLELRDYRSLIVGKDVLEGLDVHPEHLRLHLEHGLRSMHRELVRLYLDRGARIDETVELRRDLRKMLFLLEGLLLVRGEKLERPVAVERLVDTYLRGLTDPKMRPPWEALKRLSQKDVAIRGESARELYGALFDALSQLIAVVDAMEAQPAAS